MTDQLRAEYATLQQEHQAQQQRQRRQQEAETMVRQGAQELWAYRQALFAESQTCQSSLDDSEARAHLHWELQEAEVASGKDALRREEDSMRKP